jgi:hypothetical protein
MQAAQQRGDSEAAAQAAGTLVGTALGGDATLKALAPERLSSLLPASLGSLPRGGPDSAYRDTAFGIQFSEAAAHYDDGRGQSIRVSIQDTGGMSGLVSLASWLATEEDTQTPTGYERTYKSNNRTVHEHWIRTSGQNAMGYGEYDVTVGQRYIVKVSGQVAAIDTLRSAVESMDLARLESLR